MLEVGDRIHCLNERQQKRIKTMLTKQGIETEPKQKEDGLWLEVIKVDCKRTN